MQPAGAARGRAAGTVLARRQRRLHPGDIDLEVFETKRKLITIQSLRTAAELRALRALNDQSQALDLGACSRQLGSLTSGLRGQVAHQPMQRIDIGGERGEIEIHARKSNADLRRHPRSIAGVSQSALVRLHHSGQQAGSDRDQGGRARGIPLPA
jgi:hypothetical protein